MEQTNAIKRTKALLPNISPKSWEHPADRAALTALKKIPGLDALLQKMVGVTTERSIRLITLASAVRVSDHQFPKVHRLHREACAIFGIVDAPELFVSQTPFLNAQAVGVDKPFIVLNSALVESLNEEELLAVIGHELGHCLSGHVLYKTLLQILLKFSVIAFSAPLGGAALLPIIIALREWDRKSELSADRAGLLVTQDPTICYSMQMKFAGGSNLSEMDINEFFLQAAEYERAGSMVDSVHKLLNLMGQSHPFPVIRLAELKTWVDSGAYNRILAGDYRRKDQDGEDSVMQNLRDAANRYKEDINSSEDPLAETLRNAMESADAMRSKAKSAFDTFFNGKKPE